MTLGRIGLKFDYRDRKKYEALNRADEALYQLWKHCEVDSELSDAVNTLQHKFIHPAIREMETKAMAKINEEEEMKPY